MLLLTPPTSIDLKALDLLATAERKLGHVRTLYADFRSTVNSRTGFIVRTGTIRLVRPNLARIDESLVAENQKGEKVNRPKWSTTVSDGKTVWNVSHLNHAYDSLVAAENGRNISLKLLEPIGGFFTLSHPITDRIRLMLGWNNVMKELRILGPGRVRMKYRQVGTQQLHTQDFVLENGLVTDIKTWDSTGRKGRLELRNLRINGPLDESAFHYAPPPGYRLTKA